MNLKYSFSRFKTFEFVAGPLKEYQECVIEEAVSVDSSPTSAVFLLNNFESFNGIGMELNLTKTKKWNLISVKLD